MQKILFSQVKIKRRVAALARQITRDYRGKKLVLVGVLKGAFIFMADLSRALKIPAELDFIQVSSYGSSTKPSRKIKIKKNLDLSMAGKDVLLVEDIVDYGFTMKFLLKYFRQRKARSVRVCTFLDKPSRRKVKVPIAYRGFKVPDEFIVGYGLDFAEKHRNLPYIAALPKA